MLGLVCGRLIFLQEVPCVTREKRKEREKKTTAKKHTRGNRCVSVQRADASSWLEFYFTNYHYY